MKFASVNPKEWSLHVGYSQAQVIEGAQKVVMISGQTAVDESGAPQCEGDMRGQMQGSIAQMMSVLRDADLQMGNVAFARIYTTDVDLCMQNWDILKAAFDEAQIAPAMSLLGVTRLALRELMFEIEATAFA